MLERASACLDSRIWSSRRATKCLSHKRGLLHSSFWDHGADNLRPPPFGVGHKQEVWTTGRQVGLGEQSIGPRPSQTREGVFLDFLYPPQALALLQRWQGDAGSHAHRRTTRSSRDYSSGPVRMSRLRSVPNQTPLASISGRERADRRAVMHRTIQHPSGHVTRSSSTLTDLRERPGNWHNDMTDDPRAEMAARTSRGAAGISDTLDRRKSSYTSTYEPDRDRHVAKSQQASRKSSRLTRDEAEESLGQYAVSDASDQPGSNDDEISPLGVVDGSVARELGNTGLNDASQKTRDSDLHSMDLANAESTNTGHLEHEFLKMESPGKDLTKVLHGSAVATEPSDIKQATSASRDMKSIRDHARQTASSTSITPKLPASVQDLIASLQKDPRMSLKRLTTAYNNIPKGQHQINPTLLKELVPQLARYRLKPSASAWLLSMYSRLEPRERPALLYDEYVRTQINGNRISEAVLAVRQAIDHNVSGDTGYGRVMAHYMQSKAWEKGLQWREEIRTHLRAISNDEEAGLLEAAMYFHMNDIDACLRGAQTLIRMLARGDTAMSTAPMEDALSIYLSRLCASLASANNYALYRARIYEFSEIVGSAEQGSKVDRGSATLSTLSSQYTYLVEDVLKELLKQPQSLCHDAFSGLVGDIWQLLSDSSGYRPSKDVMLAMLNAWKDARLRFALPPTRNRKDSVLPTAIRQMWRKNYRTMTYVPQLLLSIIHAKAGDVATVESLAEEHRRTMRVDPRFFWPLVYVHGVRRDAAGAQSAFDAIARKYQVKQTPQVWDLLAYAYFRALDVEGLTKTLQARLDAKVETSSHSFTPVLYAYARLGNIDAVMSIMRTIEERHIATNTHVINALIVTHANAGDQDEALSIFDTTVEQHSLEEISGPIHICYNSMLSMYARNRDYKSALDLYQRMRRTKVRLDEQAFASILIVLALRAQANAAWHILTRVMPDDRVASNSMHFAIVIMAYVQTREYDRAIEVWYQMNALNLPRTPGAYQAYLTARALKEDVSKGEVTINDTDSSPVALKDTAKELLRVLDEDVPFTMGQDLNVSSAGSRYGSFAYFDLLVKLNGRRRCFDAVWELFQIHIANAADNPLKSTSPPVQLTTALMSVYSRLGERDQVKACWDLLLESSEKLGLVSMPKALKPRGTRAAQVTEYQLEQIGQVPGDSTQVAKHTRRSAKIKPGTPDPLNPKYVANRGRRFLLSDAFETYIQTRLGDPACTAGTINSLIGELLSLLSQGFDFRSGTYNTLIQRLCTMDPPRALLAFALTERFLIPGFPGWKYPRMVLTNQTRRPMRTVMRERVEYIAFAKRFVGPDDRLPQYRTMVLLAHAMLRVRRTDMLGDDLDARVGAKEATQVRRQIGEVGELVRRAPKTVEQVRNMPIVLDGLQRKWIRNDEEDGRLRK